MIGFERLQLLVAEDDGFYDRRQQSEEALANSRRVEQSLLLDTYNPDPIIVAGDEGMIDRKIPKDFIELKESVTKLINPAS